METRANRDDLSPYHLLLLFLQHNRETYSDFHEYCLERFNKTRRHIDRWIVAAAVLDNLTESGCTVLPTAESVLRPIASLPPERQVEVWNRALEAAESCPTAKRLFEKL